MTTMPIDNFDDVILFELQRKISVGQYPSLTFSELMKVTKEASPNFLAPVSVQDNRVRFFGRLFDTLKTLEHVGWLQIIVGSGGNTEEVRLTDDGKEYVKGIVYSNQRSRISG